MYVGYCFDDGQFQVVVVVVVDVLVCVVDVVEVVEQVWQVLFVDGWVGIGDGYVYYFFVVGNVDV